MTTRAFSCSRRTATRLLLLTPLVLAGCKAATLPAKTMTPVGGPIRLGVSAIDILNEYAAPGVRPHIDHILNPSPASRLMAWAGETLAPADDRGNLLMTITRAALTEERLDGDESLKGLFTNEQTRLIRIEIEAYFSFSHPQSSRSATLTVKAAYETTIAESTTPKEADQVRLAVIDEGVGRFDAEFRRQLAQVAGGGGWPKA